MMGFIVGVNTLYNIDYYKEILYSMPAGARCTIGNGKIAKDL